MGKKAFTGQFVAAGVLLNVGIGPAWAADPAGSGSSAPNPLSAQVAQAAIDQPPQPGEQPDQQAKAPGNSQTEPSPADSFTGKIVKDGAEYVLRAGGSTTYHLDQQSELQRFENQNVRVTGRLETGSNTIHVVKIELLS